MSAHETNHAFHPMEDEAEPESEDNCTLARRLAFSAASVATVIFLTAYQLQSLHHFRSPIKCV